MRSLGKIVSQLAAVRRTMQEANDQDDGRLEELTGFRDNPGALDARVYLPAGRPTALVVVLHGCTQNASVYDRGSGWSELAARQGFALLYPQQRRTNNPNLCLNWYRPEDAQRGRGEPESIAQMVRSMADRYQIDASRTFITGLSAGGAMTSIMLATYPELFAGGAIIAGLPFGAASTLPDALERMRGEGFPSRAELASRVQAASDYRGLMPTLSVWHGTHDNIVHPANAVAIADQWRDLHGLGEIDAKVDAVAGHRRHTWFNSNGQAIVTKYDIRGMGHGTPLDTGRSDACGTVGPHMLEAGICSTRQIARSWGLLGESVELQGVPSSSSPLGARGPEASSQRLTPHRSNVSAIIEDALRSAGLMR